MKFCRWPESSTECWARRGSVRPGTGATTASTSRGPETSRNTGLASSPAGPTVATEPPTKKLFRNFYFYIHCFLDFSHFLIHLINSSILIIFKVIFKVI